MVLRKVLVRPTQPLPLFLLYHFLYTTISRGDEDGTREKI